VTELRFRVEELRDEVVEHRHKLDALSTRLDRTTETTDSLQTAVSDLPELRVTLEQTAADVQLEHGTLEELSTLQSRSAACVEQLRSDVSTTQSEVLRHHDTVRGSPSDIPLLLSLNQSINPGFLTAPK